MPLRVIFRLLVGMAVMPGKIEGEKQDRYDDEEHQHGCDDDEIRLLTCNIAGWRHYDHLASTEREQKGANSEEKELF